METKKFNRVNLEKYRGIFFLLGLILSLTAAYFLINCSTEQAKTENLNLQLQANFEDEQIIVTQRKLEPPKPPQPKNPAIIQVVPDDKKLVDNFTFNLGIDESDSIIIEPIEGLDTDDGIDNDTIIYDLLSVSRGPVFNGGEQALIRYIAEHIKYPQLAIEYGIEGTVFVRFVVKKNGEVSDVEVIKGVDPLLDEEAVRVIKTLPRFEPAIQAGHPVNVRMIVPIQFKLTR